MINHPGNVKAALSALKNNDNNAVAALYEPPRGIGDGPLAGAVFTIKDNYATSDLPTHASTLILGDWCAHYDAEVVMRIINAGGVIVAKTHMDELGLGGSGTFSAYGLIANVHDKTRLMGGSSSGAAATFSKDITFAIGSDTGDSVRLPASYGGLVGFKPSYGAISRYGLLPYAPSLDTVAYFSHDVNDAIMLSDVLYGVDDKDMTSIAVDKPQVDKQKPQRIAFLNPLGVLSPKIDIAFSELKKHLSATGVETAIVNVDEKILKAIGVTYMVISFSEAASTLANLNGVNFGSASFGDDWSETMLKTRSDKFGYMVQRRLAIGAWFLKSENQERMFRKAQRVRRVITDTFASILNDYDLLVFPAAQGAPKITEGKANNWYSDYLGHANLAGTPSIVLPWTVNEDNMPVGLSVDAARLGDKRLLAQANWLADELKKVGH